MRKNVDPHASKYRNYKCFGSIIASNGFLKHIMKRNTDAQKT